MPSRLVAAAEAGTQGNTWDLGNRMLLMLQEGPIGP